MSLAGSREYIEAQVWGLDEAGTDSPKNEIPAFWNLEDLDDDEQVKQWMDTAIHTLQANSVNFTRKCVENLMFYKGVQPDPVRQYDTFQDAHRFMKNNQVSLNIIYEFVELWVNRTATYKANITGVPTTDDVKARDNAEAKELALKDYIHKHKINSLLNRFQRQAMTFGECYIHVFWEQDSGALHPEFSRIENKYKELKRVSTAAGEDVNVNRVPRIGDVRSKVTSPIYVFHEDREWEDLDYVIVNEPENVFKIRSDYTDKDIKGSGDIDCFILYFLPTKYLPQGRYVKYAGGEVLENTRFPLAKPVFPLIRMTDIDITGSNRGKSFIENIKPHQVLINETISETWNNLRRTAKGKWVAPAKTVNPRHFAPQSPAVEYYGAIKPEYISYPSIKGEALEFIRLLREYAEKQARIHGVVQGNPPPNVRSGLQFAQLEEQEKRSVEIVIEKRHAAIEQLCEVISLFMAQFYSVEDGRTITLYGKGKEYLTQALKVDALKEDHAIKIKNDDSLPTGKASQMSFFMDIRDRAGSEVVPNEMLIDMLDSGRFNNYTEYAGATVETTFAQIGTMLEGRMPEAPAEHEDLILKWKLLIGTMRKRSFLTYSKEVQEIFRKTVYAIEDMIINKKNKSPVMEEKIQMLESFPVYYTPPREEFADPQPMLPPAAQIPPELGAALAGQAEAPADGLEEIPAAPNGQPVG